MFLLRAARVQEVGKEKKRLVHEYADPIAEKDDHEIQKKKKGAEQRWRVAIVTQKPGSGSVAKQGHRHRRSGCRVESEMRQGRRH